MTSYLALLHPVLQGRNAAFPGVVILAIGLFGVLSLPSQLANLRPFKYQWQKVSSLVVADVAFVAGGLVMLTKGLGL